VNVELQYGEEGLLVEGLPDGRTTVVEPSHLPHAPDEYAAVKGALREPVSGAPLRELVRAGQTVAISVCDGTRPQPREVVVPAILDELESIVRLEDVVVLVATGTHRGNTDGELRAMLGDDVVNTVRVVNHDARDNSSLAWVGTLGADVPVWVNTDWLAADVRITTGFVEPHFFAGFSGGPKMVAPGLAGLETTLVLHDGRRIGHPNARWGITEGNPVHDDVRAIAAATGVTFALDVVLDGSKRIARAFGGELFAMHRAATETAKRAAMRALPRRFEVVLTTNSGYPLDQNLYQAVKGMSAAAQVVQPGGTIICAAECRDGFPDHSDYRSQLTSGSSPAALLEEIERRTQAVPDQWEIQIQAKIQSSARVIMHTSYLTDPELAEAHLEQTDDIARCIGESLTEGGPGSHLCVLPWGPLTIPYIDESAAELGA
jgi:nickel-dependent lactate racemase